MRSRSDMIAYALARAPSDSDKAEDVLSFFCDAVENGEPPDPRILAYLAEQFRLMVGGRPVEQKPVTPDNKPGNPEKRGIGGTPAAEALGLLRKRGRRRGRTLERVDERDTALARAVIRLMGRSEGRMLRDDAFEHVAGETGASVAVVKRAYEEHRLRALGETSEQPPPRSKV